jgi:endonuclease/exonuclease/phosphatase family metal-dependent hydrolase
MNAVYEHGHHGNALLSRFPITTQVNHDVSDHAYEQRGILHAVVRANQVDIHCFVIHLGLFAASRRRQIQALIDTIQRDTPADAPLIIAGDFNDWNQRLSSALYEQLGVVEAFDVDGQHGTDKFSARSGAFIFAVRRCSCPHISGGLSLALSGSRLSAWLSHCRSECDDRRPVAQIVRSCSHHGAS